MDYDRKRWLGPAATLLAGAAAALVLGGCAGSTSGGKRATTHAGASAAIAFNTTQGRSTINGARFRWHGLPSGEVCYQAVRIGHDHPGGNGVLSACVRHLHADEIAYVMRARGTGQQMIAGIKGAKVRSVYLQIGPSRRWTPPSNRHAFFGYVPRGRVVAIVKVGEDGRRRSFGTDAVSK
jgi:hypothetical protein